MGAKPGAGAREGSRDGFQLHEGSRWTSRCYLRPGGLSGAVTAMGAASPSREGPGFSSGRKRLSLNRDKTRGPLRGTVARQLASQGLLPPLVPGDAGHPGAVPTKVCLLTVGFFPSSVPRFDLVLREKRPQECAAAHPAQGRVGAGERQRGAPRLAQRQAGSPARLGPWSVWERCPRAAPWRVFSPVPVPC